MIYQMDDGAVVDTERALDCWQEESDWNGNNHISRATGSQWEHETLYKSTKGRYYVEHVSQWQGSLPYAFFLSPEAAALWLLNNGHPLPEDLAEHEAAICE